MKRIVVAAMLAAALLLAPHAARADELDRLRQQALALVNQSRAQGGLPPLVLEAKLNKAAQGHADDMLKRRYFAHASPEGKSAADRYKLAGGGKWRLTAENIATFTGIRPPVPDPFLKRLQDSWMNSPGHRKNILLRGLTEFGFGIAADAAGNLYAVQNFAGPGANTVVVASGTVKPIGPKEQIALVLAMVNAERQKAGQPPVGADAALTTGAKALLPGPGENSMGLETKNVLDVIPATDRKSWSTVDVVGAACGGCGTLPVRGDITTFAGQWMNNAKYRSVLLKAEVTHLGFAIGADGAGKKVAIAVFGERERH